MRTALFLSAVALTTDAWDEPKVLASVPVVFGGYDIMEYWNSDKAVMGSSEYAMNITSKDENKISRLYQIQFSSQANMNKFKTNQTYFMPQYGGF
mmetsp:Transcript_69134/g.62059  ORF Transcript_69134/g.62059 Transcript_69134/m.62059 type:complete len:95 (+) Transcript_69134:59-343(+)